MEKTINQVGYSNFTTKRMTFIALFTSLAVVFTLVFPSIPLPFTPVPITLQTLIVILAGLLLRPTDAFLSMFLYVCLGAIGLPVFSNGSGGMAILAGPSGGFLLAFPLAAFFISISTNIINEKLTNHKLLYIGFTFVINIVFGVVLINAVGGIGLSIVLGQSYINSLLLVLIYIPGDLVKALMAAFIKFSLKDYNFYN